MGLRGCVDAWGNPVTREGFTRPALTEPKPALSNKPPTLTKPTLTAEPPDVAKPTDTARFDKSAYQREYMRAKRAKAKGPGQGKP